MIDKVVANAVSVAPRKWTEVLVLLLVISMAGRVYVNRSIRARCEPSDLTLCGVELAMKRSEVIKSLRPPTLDGPDPNHIGFRIAKYGDGIFGQPNITYNHEGQVVAVSADTLKWHGGSLAPAADLQTIQTSFPDAEVLNEPSYLPGEFGQRYSQEHDLTIWTRLDGPMWWTTEIFQRAELAVPLLACPPWQARLLDNDLLARTARMSAKPTRAQLESAQVVACFYCAKTLHQPPFYHPRDPQHGSCPSCHQPALLYGTAQKITSSYIQEVHREWLDPTRHHFPHIELPGITLDRRTVELQMKADDPTGRAGTCPRSYKK